MIYRTLLPDRVEYKLKRNHYKNVPLGYTDDKNGIYLGSGDWLLEGWATVHESVVHGGKIINGPDQEGYVRVKVNIK